MKGAELNGLSLKNFYNSHDNHIIQPEIYCTTFP